MKYILKDYRSVFLSVHGQVLTLVTLMHVHLTSTYDISLELRFNLIQIGLKWDPAQLGPEFEQFLEAELCHKM
jgi:hypothetical protein